MLKNCIILMSYELVYLEDGMLKEWYCVYYEECVKVGVGMIMMVGLVIVLCDSLLVFNNIFIYKDEVVLWLKDLVDVCYGYDCVVMI